MKIILRGNIPAKKNNRIGIRTKQGRNINIPSKAYTTWENKAINEMREQKIMPIDWVFHLHYDFYFDSLRNRDLSNVIQSFEDMSVKYWLFEDDNWKVMNEISIKGYLDRADPRMEVTITKIAESIEETF